MIEKIAHITDLHLDEQFPFEDQSSARKRFDRILKSIKDDNIDHVVCTGDIGENKGIPYFFEQLKNMNFSITLGNHDEFIEISKYYRLGANYDSKKIYRSVVEKDFKFIYLDSSSAIIDVEQLIWLRKELITSKPIIIFIHHPIIGLNLKVDEIGKLQNRKDLTKILTEVTNEVTVYCGHYHMESTLVYKNITQCITPAVAFQIKKSIDKILTDTTRSGYRVIQIKKTELSSKVKFITNAD
ncbi:metallophosphoesterase [uncultured Croceitalea sp.]|uniref:metallophosphoesterase family protein n=1 Tax=uncultured Croceitalea sp. TaxID=1798908 RepID=UPI003305F625